MTKASKQIYTHLKVGQKAPDFSIKNQEGKVVSLKEFKGKKLIIYFYPKDNTPGCTAQACNLKDNYSALQKQGYEILGVSADSEKAHKGFISKYELPFMLLADTEKEMITSYGAWGEKSMYGKKYMGIMRYTFIISEKGIIENIITEVDTKNHSKQISEF
ncbi:MAG: thioredoxin-dependent thiol peroxidase [Bacteroidetes bacterium]|nr:thioredoxin-dependent thiol peroxidase [Bacteroidota bacterium]